ncbi:MAG: hypothetical protein JXB47_01075 [Anaerolineae bacterium]|nr:hypothetical protein [Anaerolineae bacterium]
MRRALIVLVLSLIALLVPLPTSPDLSAAAYRAACGHVCASNVGAACGDPVCGSGSDSRHCGGCSPCFYCCCGCPGGCGGGPSEYCGDGSCNGGESCSSCPDDCGSCCGNGACDNGETYGSCKKDCVPPPPGVDPDPACLPGDSRTVTLTNTVGDSFQIEMQGGPTVDASSYTFTGLAHDVGYSFRGRQHDQAGWSSWSGWSGAVQQDLQPPTTTSSLGGIDAGGGNWASPVNVSLSATDSGCLGIANIFYDIDGAGFTPGDNFTVSGDGPHTVSFYASDGHNDEAAQNISFCIDTTPPVTTVNLSGERGVNDWWVSNVQVSLSATDNGGCLGVQNIFYDLDGAGFVPGDALVIPEGKHTLSFYATDGYNDEAAQTVTVLVDTTPPQVTLICDWAWWQRTADRTHIVLDVNGGSDDTSGLDSWDASIWVAESNREYTCGGPVSLLPYAWAVQEYGLHRISFSIQDYAGNVTAFRDTCTHNIEAPAPDASPPPAATATATAAQTQTGTYRAPATSPAATATQTATPTTTATLTLTPTATQTAIPAPPATQLPAATPEPEPPQTPRSIAWLMTLPGVLLFGSVLVYAWGDRKSRELEEVADGICDGAALWFEQNVKERK